MMDVLGSLTLLDLGFHKTPWWLLGGVLGAAILSRGLVFLWVMLKKNR